MITRKLSAIINLTIMKSVFCFALIITIFVLCGQMQVSFGDDWNINLSRLRVSDAQEEDWLSDGDEPYFIIINFRSRFNTPNSTATWNNDYNDDKWANGVDDGNERNIHFSMGYSLFGNVQRISLQNIIAGTAPEILGALVIAMESDSSPWGTIGDMVEDLRDAIEGELEQLVEDGGLNLLNPGPGIQDSLQDIRDSITPDFWESVGMVIEAGGDPDDLIGYHLFLFAAVNNTVPINFPAVANVTSGRLITREFLIGVNPIVFRGDGATYRVTARVQPCPVLFAPKNPKVANQTVSASGKATTSWGKIKNE
ncbi:MAG: hypothetical protein AAB116_04675 [Candidatus Poribacteria bacterium]